MTQPPHWQPADYGSQSSAEYGPRSQYGQPQYGQQPAYVAPSYPQPQFYGPGPYPPPHPPKRSYRGLILAIIGVLVVAGGAAAAVLMLTGANSDKHASRSPVASRPGAFPSSDAMQRQGVTGLGCIRIRNALTRGGTLQAGAVKVSDGGTVPRAAPQPAGTPTTRCTLSSRHPAEARGAYRVVVVAWSGVTARDFAAQLKSAGYHSAAKDGYTLWINSRPAEPRVVTATIADRLVTLYLAA